jgi:hypothetical protein
LRPPLGFLCFALNWKSFFDRITVSM